MFASHKQDNWTIQAETQLNALLASVHNLSVERSDRSRGTLTVLPLECTTICRDVPLNNSDGSDKSNGSVRYERKRQELDQHSGSWIVYQKQQGVDNGKRTSGEWTLASSFLYAFSVITTIGYGHVTPSTLQGKMVTVLYAIVGIPIMLLFLRNIGICLAVIFRRLFAHLFSCSADGLDPNYRRASRCSIRVRRHSKRDSEPSQAAPSLFEIERLDQTVADGTQTEETPKKRKVHVPVVCCLLIMISYVLSGSLLFALWEDWPFLDAFYFCFVTLTTIGFGDLVPGAMLEQDPSSQKLIGCCVYVLLGLALIACCFNLMQEQVRWYAVSLAKCVGILPHERRPSDECHERRQSCVVRNGEQNEEQERIIVATQVDHGT
ncbi:hypothetical protein RvY_14133-2 [Ramazzottius varieornatus]|uniref:Potassium channel domain-containing protein n=1 Tax=Ramazzottius varieornatus TaxID=947166 RepID=A0A1D1VS01_RAMVA|nr:hypothetical protein RvY_14133-2 [Ramazzottius varieornatus]